MNTTESRRRLAELTRQALRIVERLRPGEPATAADSVEMRDILREAREVAYDAGYPGDAAWRALLRTSVYINGTTVADEETWADAREALTDGLQALIAITETAAEA